MANNFELNTNEYLNQCSPKDVISFNSEQWISVDKFKNVVHQSLSRYSSTIDNDIRNISGIKYCSTLFNQGGECEILRAGSKGWQKGKLKINVTLEFIPDEPEERSPLDDVRQEIDKSNS